MAIWEVQANTPQERIKSAMYFVTTLKIPHGTNAGKAAADFLALGVKALGSVTADPDKEIEVGTHFERLIHQHVRGVREAWQALDNAMNSIISEADALGEADWDVTLHVKGETLGKQINRQAGNLAKALEIAAGMDDGEAKLLASLATLFPSEALVTDFLGKSIEANPADKNKLVKIVRKHVDGYVNLRWSSRVDIDLEWVRNAYGHGQAELTNAGLRLMKSRTSSDEVVLTANQLLEYPRVAIETWTAYQMKTLLALMLGIAK